MFNLIDRIKEINDKLNEKDTNELNLIEDNNVSELHMHKILYIVFGGFYSKFKKELFNPNFEAWKYGPVEIDYRKNKNNKKSLKKFDINFPLKKKEEKFLNDLIKNLLKSSPWSLVEYTHSTDAWSDAYNNPKNKNNIPTEKIKESFERTYFE